MNWLVTILIIIAALALIVFLIIRNQKDKKDLMNKLNNDYRKSKEEENDIDAEEIGG